MRFLIALGYVPTLFCLTFLAAPAICAEEISFGKLGSRLESEILPLVHRLCTDCHTGESAEAEVDLALFSTLADVRRQPRVWQQVRAMLDTDQMPPPESEQPTEEERTRLQTWVREYLTVESSARAGDPGRVVLRRLNNAEYTYTLRDLTGVKSLDPAREFPADSAAGEGFTNTGNALVMSPALVTKYLDAAKLISEHAVLLPDGFRFSPRTTRRDWTEESLTRIRDFYDRHSDTGGGTAVNLQGIQFETNQGGRLAVDKYLAATLAAREALKSGRRSLDEVAREYGLNARYLGTLWRTLTDDADSESGIDAASSLLLNQLRQKWQSSEPKDAPRLAAEIKQWQDALWKFNSIGHIGRHLGRQDGPQAWMEPVTPLAARQDFRLKLEPEPGKEEITLYLSASDAGDGNEHDYVVWENPRLVAPGRTDLALRDVRAVITQGLAPELFGRHPQGGVIDAASLCVQAPATIEIRLPADLVDGYEFVTTGTLHHPTGIEGSVQLEILSSKPDRLELTPRLPVIVLDNSPARKRLELAMDAMRQFFPAALCYTKIVPVDEVVTLTLFYREDDQLRRLMLSEDEASELDRLWDELFYISQEPLLLAAAFEQLVEYATQDRPDMVKAFEPMHGPVNDRAASFEQRLIDTEPEQLSALLSFAARAYRRPLTSLESEQLLDLYANLRAQEIAHDDALRLTLARVLVAPAFLYRIEQTDPGSAQHTVTDYELASRLSYFLWSSLPDDELLQVAASGRLRDDNVLLAQMRRMLDSPKARRLATEFAGQWLHIHDFDQHDEKSERHFPTFAALRSAMYEESLLLFTDLLQNDGTVLDLLNADYTYLNEDLAKHYEIPGVSGSEWRRVEGIQKFSRGGILTQATTLSKQSGASRTSPILRGNWISEVILGERLPRPPKDVPVLADAPPEGLTERQLIEKHSSDPACAKCHVRIDPLGFALEHFDAIGRFRERDTAGLPIDVHTELQDGTKLQGHDGLRDYLLNERRDDFLRQFSRKLLGYALGRSVQLSDEPLLADIQVAFEERQYRVTSALEAVILSRQFREIRGRDWGDDE